MIQIGENKKKVSIFSQKKLAEINNFIKIHIYAHREGVNACIRWNEQNLQKMFIALSIYVYIYIYVYI